MNNRSFRRVLHTALAAAAILSFVPAVAAADFATPDHHGLRDIVLVYRGRDPVTAPDLVPLVTYIDRTDTPRAWFFDAVLLLPSKVFIDFTGRRPLTVDHWRRWLDALFSDGGMVPQLQRAVVQAAALLGARPRPLQVILALGDPGAPDQRAFGDLDGDGRPERLLTNPARANAIEWLMDRILYHWRQRPRQGLNLWGFYWYPEAVHDPDQALVRAVTAAAHRRGLKMLWIPWFRAPGWARWRELGFDLAVLQPNYAFLPPVAGAHLPDDARLAEAAALARARGLGVEIETRYALDQRPYDRALLRLYLNHAITDGYARAVRAHFHSYDQYVRLARADDPDARALYDDLFALHRGELVVRPLSVLHGAAAALVSPDGQRRDVSWLVDEVRSGQPVSLRRGEGLQIRLPQPRAVSELRFRLAADAPVPRAFDVYALRGNDRTFIASVTGLPLPHARLLMSTWPEQVVDALWIEPVLFSAGRCEVKTIVSFPALADLPVGPGAAARRPQGQPGAEQALTNVALGRPYAVWPDHERLYPDSGRELTDGALTERGFPDGRTVGWHRTGRVTVELDIGQAGPLDAVRVHCQGGGMGAVRWPRAIWADVSPDGRRWRLVTDRPAQRVVELRRHTPHGSLELGWLIIRAEAPEPARFVRVTMVPDGWLMLSEIEVLSAGRNVARGRPYRLRPLPSAKDRYADDGIMLTDGIAMKLWSRCVGWTSQRAAVAVDLGRQWRVERVEVYVLGGGAGAVFFPRSVQVSVADTSPDSLIDLQAVAAGDAIRWSEPVEAKMPPADESGRVEAAWAVAQLSGRRARLVRIDLHGRGGWLMVGEIRVWATR